MPGKPTILQRFAMVWRRGFMFEAWHIFRRFEPSWPRSGLFADTNLDISQIVLLMQRSQPFFATSSAGPENHHSVSVLLPSRTSGECVSTISGSRLRYCFRLLFINRFRASATASLPCFLLVVAPRLSSNNIALSREQCVLFQTSRGCCILFLWYTLAVAHFGCGALWPWKTGLWKRAPCFWHTLPMVVALRGCVALKLLLWRIAAVVHRG